MPRKKKITSNQSALALFLESIIADQRYSAKRVASDLGISGSMLSAWRQGSFPAGEQMPKLKKLANANGKSLSQILVGEADENVPPEEYDRVDFLDSLCEIKIVRLIPKRRTSK